MTTGYCPLCGKLIAYRFPMHTCKPTKNFLRLKRLERKNIKQIVDRKRST